jgi:beta-glucanase (GH16 family)
MRSKRRKPLRRRHRLGVERLELRAMLSGNLVFEDEFNLAAGSQPNSSTWFNNTGTSPNNSNVNYVDTPSTLQVVSDAGAIDGKALAMSLYPDPNNAGKYLASRINTTVDPIAGNWQYGHVEARIKMPGGPNGQGVGIWPAFWLLGTNINTVGWPNCGEVDIMENKGSTPGQIQGTIHGPGYSGGSGITAYYNLPSGQNFYSAYHVFAADWGPNFINFSVDGQLYASRSPANLPSGTSWAFNHPFYVILDIQEGGAFAGGPGPNSTYPQTMMVDYVRAAAFPLSAVPPLTDADIGSPGQAGSSNFDGLAWTVRGSGSDIWNTSDQFHFTSQSFTGDLTITARIDNLLNTGTYAKAGLMIRDGTAANAAYAFVFANPPNGQTGDGVNFELRTAAGASSQAVGSKPGLTAPQWLRLQRVGNTFTAYDSADGVTWTQLGPSESISMASTVNVGLAVDANSNSTLNTAMFRSVSIVPGGWSDADIGSPGAAGFASFDPASSSWTVCGSGSDIWNAADQFNFASQGLSGDGTILARVTAQANTNAWAKAGVMLRNDETAGSAFADVVITPGNGVSFQWRSAAGAAAASTTIGGISVPAWVRLTRLSNAISGYYSTDGVQWTQIGATQTIAMGATTVAGLAVAAHDNMALSAATFSSVGIVATQVTNNLDSGPGSLRQALLNAATIQGPPQTIRFTLPAGSQTINLLTPLPMIGQPLSLMLDSTQHVTIVFPPGSAWNNSNSLTLTGSGTLTLQEAIDGTGNLTISAGSALTASHIRQNTLAIGGITGNAATVTIAPSDASGDPLIVMNAVVAAPNSTTISSRASSSGIVSTSAAATASITSMRSAHADLKPSLFGVAMSIEATVGWASSARIEASGHATSALSSASNRADSVQHQSRFIGSTYPTAVSAVFDDPADLEWLLSPPAAAPSAFDADVLPRVDELLETMLAGVNA